MKTTVFTGKKAYRLSAIVTGCIIVLGFGWQLAAGNFDFKLLEAPVNLFLGGVIVLLIVVFSFFYRSPAYRWFTGIPFSVTLIAGILIFCLFMGLTVQSPERMPSATDPYTLLGLRQIPSSWPFVLLYLVLLLSLGTLIARRLITFSIRDYAFYFNHTGLWLILFSAGLGAADTREYTLYVKEGETVSRGYAGNETFRLPLSIHLHDFDMEEYPEPRQFVSDVELLTENRKQVRALIEVNKPLKTGNWSIYQYGYDYSAGKQSEYSILKIVYDPWLYAVYAGIILLAAGAVCMLWSKKQRTGE
jgi:cytochrome c biogenesis factor